MSTSATEFGISCHISPQLHSYIFFLVQIPLPTTNRNATIVLVGRIEPRTLSERVERIRSDLLSCTQHTTQSDECSHRLSRYLMAFLVQTGEKMEAETLHALETKRNTSNNGDEIPLIARLNFQ